MMSIKNFWSSIYGPAVNAFFLLRQESRILFSSSKKYMKLSWNIINNSSESMTSKKWAIGRGGETKIGYEK